MNYFQFRAMNSDILLAAEGTSEQVTVGFTAARKFIDESEQRFTRFSDQSELSQMNRAAGKWFNASPALFELVRLALEYYTQTGGLFDPSILPDLKRAGYDRSMDDIRIYGARQHPPISKRKKFVFGAAQLDRDTGKVYIPPGMEIDLGGIAKGWIAEQAAQVLAHYTTACAVNAGGDMVLIGIPQGQSKWEIALEDPRDPTQRLALLRVGPGAVATSSVTKRNWLQGKKHQHHLIDPRSGEPVITGWLSATVVAARATTAEVYAKVLLISGPEQAMDLFSKNGAIAFVAVDRQGKLWGSQEGIDVDSLS